MKKIWLYPGLNPAVYEMLTKMKLTIFLICITVLGSFAADSYAQTTRLTLDAENATIKSILAKIEGQSEFKFFYSSNVNVDQTASISQKNKKVFDILDDLFKDTGIKYKVYGRQIALMEKGETFTFPTSETVAQQKSVTGKVTDDKGQPLPGVTIVIKGTTQGAVTNVDGIYSISNLAEDATLQFSFVGMLTKEVVVGNQTSINMRMEELTIGIEEVITIGYGVQKVEELTSSAASVKSEGFVEGNVTDAAQLIKGKVAGLSIVNPSGNPLSGSQITLRGVTTLASGTQPLVLIDGVPGDLNSISTENIESIDVLKSGAAAAIYGTRATNGVIMIQTKGVNRKIEPTLTLKTAFITERVRTKPDLLTASEFRELVNTSNPYKPSQSDNGANTDWMDEITREPFSYNINANMRGGDAHNYYVINLQQKDIQGVMIDSNNKESHLQLRGVHSMFNNMLEVDANMLGFLQSYNRSYDNQGTANSGTAYTAAMVMNPTDFVKDENGNWIEHVGQKDIDNPVAAIKENIGEYENSLIHAYGTITLRPIKDLSLQLRGSIKNNNHTGGNYLTQNSLSAKRSEHSGRATRNTSHSKDELLEFITTYKTNINDHSISAVGGYSWQESIWEDYSMTNSDFPNDVYLWNNISVGKQLTAGKASMSSYKAQTNLAGFFGRISYDYRKKYFLMASIRHEGSSKFGAESKWGNFPGISGGWHIGRESFMEGLNFLSNLKLRADYGITGTEPSSPYQSIPRLNLGTNVYVGGVWVPAVIPSTNENPNLQWETKKEFNIGLDFGIFNDRLSASADYYHRTTDGLIWNYVVPQPPYLYNSILANAGVIENEGFELNLNIVPIDKNNFSWNSTINLSYNKNKVTSLEGDAFKVAGGFFNTGNTGAPIQEPTHRVEEGQSVGNFYGYKSIDIDEDGFWIIEGKDGSPKSIKDKNPDDKQYLGNGLPNYYLGWNNTIRYKNFSLDVGISGAFDFQILNMDRMFNANPEAILIGNALHDLLEPVYGKRTLNITQPRVYVSYYIEDGDYVSIDNATLSYNLYPKSGFIKNVKLFLNGFNLYTFTNYQGLDPEVNVLGLAPGVDEKRKYPKTMSFSLGAEITF